MQRLTILPDGFWERLIPLKSQCVSDVCSAFSSIKFENPVEFADSVTISSGTSPSGFRSVYGETIFKGDILKAVQYDQQICEVTSDEPPEERRGKLFKYIYIPDERTQGYVDRQRDSPQSFEETTMFFHQVIDMSVFQAKKPLRNREIQALRCAVNESKGEITKYVIYTKSVESQIKIQDQCVLAELLSFLSFENTQDGVRASAFFCVGPKGKVPEEVFGQVMGAQMEILVNIRAFAGK